MTDKNVKIFDVGEVVDAIQFLEQGKILVFPTETSYGLGCDATDQSAVDKIFKIKGRASDKPLLVVVPDVAMAKKYLAWNNLLEDLTKKYWPGALTIVGEYRATSPFKGRVGVGSRINGFVRNVALRQNLRKNQTKAEVILWRGLSDKKLGGLKFRHQHGVGPYVADFYQSDSKIIIEVDGDIHFSDEKNVLKDNKRKEYLEQNGYQILRYNNVDIFNNLSGVLDDIYYLCDKRLRDPLLISPLKGGESHGDLANGVVAKDGTVAVRVTANPFLKSLTEKFGRPIVATSANLSGAGEIYNGSEAIKIFENLKNKPDAIVDAGVLSKNLPSTIVSVVGNELKILRQGGIKIKI